MREKKKVMWEDSCLNNSTNSYFDYDSNTGCIKMQNADLCWWVYQPMKRRGQWVQLKPCDDKSEKQQWEYKNGQIKLRKSDICVDVNERGRVMTRNCATMTMYWDNNMMAMWGANSGCVTQARRRKKPTELFAAVTGCHKAVTKNSDRVNPNFEWTYLETGQIRSLFEDKCWTFGSLNYTKQQTIKLGNCETDFSRNAFKRQTFDFINSQIKIRYTKPGLNLCVEFRSNKMLTVEPCRVTSFGPIRCYTRTHMKEVNGYAEEVEDQEDENEDHSMGIIDTDPNLDYDDDPIIDDTGSKEYDSTE